MSIKRYERPPVPEAESTVITWSVVVGTVQLFIMGPGQAAWLACSKPLYAPHTTPGTPAERRLAQAAVRILNQTQRTNKDAGPREIAAALKAARAEIRRDAKARKQPVAA